MFCLFKCENDYENVIMSADFIENILIPKNEYLSLKERAEKNFVKEKEMDTQINDSKVDGTSKLVESKGQASVDTNSIETAQSSVSLSEDTNGADRHTSDIGEDKEDGQAVPLNSRRQIDFDDKVPSTQSSPHKAEPIDDKENVKEDTIQRIILSDNDTDTANVSISTSKVDMLMDKVASTLKGRVKILVNYIVENAVGIIEWDNKFRFLYMKQMMPHTNIVTLLMHAVKPKEKVPKSASVFLRALRSVGIDNPIAYVTQHLNSKKKKGAGSKANIDNDSHAASISNFQTNETDMTDIPDGMETKKGAVGKKRKRNKFESLSGKWLTW